MYQTAFLNPDTCSHLHAQPSWDLKLNRIHTEFTLLLPSHITDTFLQNKTTCFHPFNFLSQKCALS